MDLIDRPGFATEPLWARITAVLAIGLCLFLLVASSVGTVSATHDDSAKSHVVVDLESDGTARLTLAVAFDLTDEDRREAFEALEADETARSEFNQRFVDRMRSAATAASDESGREMTVSNPSIDLSRVDDGETGTATLTVGWSNLAAQEDGRLVVTKPFDGGFTPAYEFVVTAPDGYRLVETSPAPDTRDETQAVWASGSPIDEFRVVVGEVESGQQDESRTSGQPGFGFVVGVVALVAAIVAVKRRRH